jgi:Kdo2-lipid IVA lauroyltransferase/acyltransferase
MSKLFSYLGVVLIYFFAFLPFPVLYLVSDFFYLLIYHVIGYRKKVVRLNLKNAFPLLSDAERLKIEKKFYHHLCDVFLETTKLISFSEEELKRRVKIKNSERFYELIKEGRNISVVFGHYHNWEWFAQALPIYIPITCYGIYKPLHNKVFDRLFLKMRTRHGIEALPMQTSMRTLIKNSNKQFSIAIIADQTPNSSDTNYWTKFLNQDTPVFMGTEKISKHFNNAVVFMDIQQVKRGFLEFEFIVLEENCNNLEEFEITELHTRFLEKKIIEKPEFWLWSHRRWKHKASDAIKLKYNLQ